MSQTTMTLVGAGGYGAMYGSAFRDSQFSDCRLIAIVDPHADKLPQLPYLRGLGARIVRDLDGIRDNPPADLAIIASPVQHHAEHAVQLLSMGSHVLCEKPLCATLEQAWAMASARNKAGRQLGVGYQWSYSAAIQTLKSDVLAGRLGAPRRLRTVLHWARDEAYYRRNRWAGRRIDEHGKPVYDSPVNNAAAHFMHNMLFVLGDALDRSATPLRVTAELYRAFAIENYDTAAIRCHVAGGAEILFLATHATTLHAGPRFEYEFENAVVRYEMGKDAEITAHFSDGSVKSYGSPEESHYQKLLAMLNTVRTGAAPLCGLEAAIAQTQVMLASQRSSEVTPFPVEMVEWTGADGQRRASVEGLDQELYACYSAGRLPSELGLPWAVAGHEVEIDAWPPRPHLQRFGGGLKVSPQVLQVVEFVRPAPRS